MKLMTINTHSLIEPEYESKREIFAWVMMMEQPDVLALQEVNQTALAPALHITELNNYVACPGIDIVIRKDNYAAWLADELQKKGLLYYWTWIPIKLGYDTYDEGIALFSRTPIDRVEEFFISDSKDYHFWKTRKVLGIRTGIQPQWFYTVHMGWWDDEDEPFRNQWKRLEETIKGKKASKDPVWLLGDFNSPSAIKGQGYDLVCDSGWYDTYDLAEVKDQGITVGGEIDGWRDRKPENIQSPDLENADAERSDSEKALSGMRMDYIFCSQDIPVALSRVFCNGDREAVVSDHYGVLIKTKRKREI